MVTWPSVLAEVERAAIATGLRLGTVLTAEGGATELDGGFYVAWNGGEKDAAMYRGNDETVERWTHNVVVVVSHAYSPQAAGRSRSAALVAADRLTRELQASTTLRALVDVEVRGYTTTVAGDWIVTEVGLELAEDRELTNGVL